MDETNQSSHPQYLQEEADAGRVELLAEHSCGRVTPDAASRGAAKARTFTLHLPNQSVGSVCNTRKNGSIRKCVQWVHSHMHEGILVCLPYNVQRVHSQGERFLGGLMVPDDH